MRYVSTGFGLRSFFGVGTSLSHRPNHVVKEQARRRGRGAVARTPLPIPPRGQARTRVLCDLARKSRSRVFLACFRAGPRRRMTREVVVDVAPLFDRDLRRWSPPDVPATTVAQKFFLSAPPPTHYKHKGSDAIVMNATWALLALSGVIWGKGASLQVVATELAGAAAGSCGPLPVWAASLRSSVHDGSPTRRDLLSFRRSSTQVPLTFCSIRTGTRSRYSKRPVRVPSDRVFCACACRPEVRRSPARGIGRSTAQLPSGGPFRETSL